MSKFNLGDIVTVTNQDITGKIIEIYDHGRNIVIDDLDSEYMYPESRLAYRASELEFLKKGTKNV